MTTSAILSASIFLVIFTSHQAYSQWTPDPFCPYPSDHVTRYPYYGNCSLYWECYEGSKYVMACPEGLEFNAPLQQCDAPEIANCDPLASTTLNPNPPTWTTDNSTGSWTPDPLCPYPSEEIVYFPYPGDCAKYWECFEGNKYTYNCPEGLWWHQEISQCDYPGDYCDESTGTPTTTIPTTPIETTTPLGTTSETAGTSTTTIPTTPIETTTPLGTTTETASTTHNTDGPTHDPLCPYPSDEATYFPVPGDCTKYYECFAGIKYTYDCPLGLWWHQEILECDYPGDFCKQLFM